MRDDLDEILAAAPKQASVSTSGNIRKVLIDALNTFPDASNVGQAYTRALWHWHHSRQENSKRGALAEIKSDTAAILQRITFLEDELAAIKQSIAEHGFD